MLDYHNANVLELCTIDWYTQGWDTKDNAPQNLMAY